MIRTVGSRAEFSAARAELSAAGGPIALVPTMGALHEGHGALLSSARRGSAHLVVTIFVNPLQFGAGEDLDRYPRPLAADLARCEQAGVDLVWVPSVDDVYRAGAPQVTVSPGPLGEILEGAVRPGHFAGVLTVVAKLLTIVAPDRAYFGEKDYQQLVLVRRMVADLDLRAEIVGVATVREPDGLALSSRNVYLSDHDRRQARMLSSALQAGADAAPRGADAVLAAAGKVLADAGIAPDYLELRSSELEGAPAAGAARLLVAARVGPTRLIDNVPVTL